MATYYDEWLGTRAVIEEEFNRSPVVARDADIPWVETPQDARSKLMLGTGMGFASMGSNVVKAEIPVGWRTGRHRHGEESLHILEGEGCSVIDGERFDWHKSSTIQIPFGAEHQHFNTGDIPVTYLSGMTWDLERFLRVARLEQLEECGPIEDGRLDSLPAATGDYYANGDRAVIHLEDAPTEDPTFSEQGKIAATKNQHDFVQHLVNTYNGFRIGSVAVTHQWIEPAFHRSGKHAHLEAVVYAVEGQGYTEMNGQRVYWEAGDMLYVPPAMWEHQHTNDNPTPVKQLRIAFGIRRWTTALWPDGFTNRRSYDADGNPIEAGPIVREREHYR